jgi:hypothetical protein
MYVRIGSMHTSLPSGSKAGLREHHARCMFVGVLELFNKITDFTKFGINFTQFEAILTSEFPIF